MKFEYQLTEKFHSDHFIQTGVQLEWTQVVKVDPIESTPRVRELYQMQVCAQSVRLPKQGRILIAADIPEILEQVQAKKEAETAKKIAEIEAQAEKFLQDLDGLGFNSFEYSLDQLLRIFTAYDLDTSALKELEVAHQAKKAEIKIDREAKNQLAEERQEADKKRRLADKTEWINAHGSAHLKRAFTAEFNCHRKYIQERASLEVPGSVIDWDDNAKWAECACPSVEALDAFDAAPEGSELVWLKRVPESETEEYYSETSDAFAPCEAIVIQAYLESRYDLIKII